jgi:predicted transposase YbfD/YdcC
MAVYLVVTDNTFSLEKIRKKFPADMVDVFNYAFLLNYKGSSWDLNDDISELFPIENFKNEIIIVRVDKTDLFDFKDADKYVKYLFDRDKNQD